MKILKFREELAKKILSKEKTKTWRLFDDKDISVGDEITCVVKETGKTFAKICIVEVEEKTFAEIISKDFQGHEKYSSKKEMYDIYSGYYGKSIDKNTPLKIIRFETIKNK
jgi:hypothetical protein